MRPIATDMWRGRFVCLSVYHADVSCKNGLIDRDAVCHVGSGEPKYPWGPDPPWEGTILGVGMPVSVYSARQCGLLSNFFGLLFSQIDDLNPRSTAVVNYWKRLMCVFAVRSVTRRGWHGVDSVWLVKRRSSPRRSLHWMKTTAPRQAAPLASGIICLLWFTWNCLWDVHWNWKASRPHWMRCAKMMS